MRPTISITVRSEELFKDVKANVNERTIYNGWVSDYHPEFSSLHRCILGWLAKRLDAPHNLNLSSDL